MSDLGFLINNLSAFEPLNGDPESFICMNLKQLKAPSHEPIMRSVRSFLICLREISQEMIKIYIHMGLLYQLQNVITPFQI